ncbi:MAG: GrrA/OscA1 family cyclophane-containing rSAM-modified RiPP [Reyranellaceae bacterium]
MAQDRRSVRALIALLPAGTLGLSVSLAAVDAQASPSSGAVPDKPTEVAKRLQSIRESLSEAAAQAAKEGGSFVKVDPEEQLAWWHNYGRGWHNGGWGLPGWHGGWGNGWHNGGWGNGWHNGGWGNGWHNW